MKTYYISLKNIALKSIVGLLGLTAISCGSYQNVSYYDNDGIYGSEKKERVSYYDNNTTPQDNSNGNKYKEYFGSQANKYSYNDQDVFTDVDSYSSVSVNDSTVTNSESRQQNYAGWGNNDRDVTINVYNNDWYGGYWGWRGYWGYRPWGYSYWNNWHNPYWDWGWSGYYGPSWGWGWNNYWGWNSPYYGGGYYGWNNWGWNNYYGRNYAYSGGRRGIYSNRSEGFYGNRYSGSGRSYETNRNFNTGGRRSSTITTPNRNYTPRESNSTEPRTYTPRRRSSENNYTPRYNEPRTSEPRTYEPRRNETPRRSETRSYDTPRSSSYDSPRSSGSSGGGSFSGGGRTGGRRG
jgi:hypothetical protein